MNVIVVHGTVAYLRNRVVPLVCGQVGFDKIHFDVDAEWEGMPLTAQFSYGADVVNVVVDDGYAVVPTLPIGVVSVRLRGDGPNGVIATANEIVLPVVRGFEDGGTPSVPPDPDLYNMLLLRVEEARDDAVAAQQAIENMQVAATTLPPGSSATVSKTVQDGVVKLTYGIPRGSGGSGSSYKIGHGLKLDTPTNTLSVNAVSDFEGDNTLPITAAAVQETVGNIEILLGTI